MAAVGSKAVKAVLDILMATAGLARSIQSVSAREGMVLPAIDIAQVVAQNVAAELMERTAGAQYPAVYVYCEGLANLLKEKFRSFSGKASMVIEVRTSHARLEWLANDLQLYIDAVTDLLDRNRGEWTRGIFYCGAYKVEFGPIKHGGKNFLQTAKVKFDLEVSA